MAKRNGLGKGLDALFIDNNTEDGAVTSLKLSEIEPNKSQPRTAFDEEALAELADSIRMHGIIQPLVVRPLEKGGYQIVAGERRWRAARRAGLSEVPVVIRDLDENQTLEIAIIENLQREDLNVVELALGYQALMRQYTMTQEQVAAKVNKSRSAVANTVRLLSLPEPVLEQIKKGEISTGHAKALLALEEEAQIVETARRVVREGLLVRDIERIASQRKKTVAQTKDAAPKTPPDGGDRDGSYLKEMELALSSELGRRVKITAYGKKYTLEVDFFNNEELADLAARLTRSNW